ncbi:hypothetical protein [Methanocella arvoryzae]|uniref:Uncharacterized protein n=1 Tax=Methanocella arvoryzae (strain DSM 22066 / NBRC 105507 / MRE50) TaxID=351160 RepID=Q0W395_METAR|nr:hypothetical protein [Methanocella arvoryzae]CAJ37148.1 hypothetical protein RCIX1988 [Methanocella arvoryzae MRE50]
MNAIKAGISAGILGIVLIVAKLFTMMLLVKAFPVSEMGFIGLATTLLCYAVPGALAGIFASRHVMSTKESLLPGLIAGGIVTFVKILIAASIIFPVIGGEHGKDLVLPMLISILLQAPFTIVLCGLCSALAVFFTRELYWSIPAREQDPDPAALKTLYDELWKDATTLVIDMNRSIRVYLFGGVLMLICGLVILGMGLAGWQYLSPRGGAASDYVIVIGEIAGGLIQIIISPYLLYWYYKLKKRYSRLIQMEKTLGA